MKKEIFFSGKLMRIFGYLGIVILDISFLLLMIFAFNPIALIVGLLMLILLDFLIIWLNIRKIVICDDSLTVVEFMKHKVLKADIVKIYDDFNAIVIETNSKKIRTSGYVYFRHFIDHDKNKELIDYLNKWFSEK